MKKRKIITGFIAILVIGLVGLVGCNLINAIMNPEIMTPTDYETTVSTGGNLEATYLAHGTHEVTFLEENTDEKWAKYEIYYPTDLENSSEKYPVIVMSNGSGVRASRYPALFEHYASWGFIVIGNEHDTAYAGDSSDASLSYLIEANEDPNSKLYQKVDLNNVGIVGHSQGGVGIFNAITNQTHSDMYKTAVSLSPVPEESAAAINWTYAPEMVMAGTNKDCITIEQLKTLYSHISSDKIMAVRTNSNHPEMLYSADGYVTAWFMWQLQGDEDAAQAFTGSNAEIMNNELYQDVQSTISDDANE